MSGPFNNEPLFPPKPVANEKLQSSTGNPKTGSKGKGKANQGGSGPGNASGGNQDKDGGAFDSHLFCYVSINMCSIVKKDCSLSFLLAPSPVN